MNNQSVGGKHVATDLHKTTNLYPSCEHGHPVKHPNPSPLPSLVPSRNHHLSHHQRRCEPSFDSWTCHVGFSVVKDDVKGTWSVDAESGKAERGGREEGGEVNEKLTRGSFWPWLPKAIERAVVSTLRVAQSILVWDATRSE